MTDPVFVDAGAWYAAAVPWDVNHTAAAAWVAQNQRPLLTTDYVVDETLTLLKVRGEGTRALSLGAQLFGGALAPLYFLSEQDVRDAWQVFRQFRDKDWSFTDCTNKVVVDKLGLTT